MNQPSTPGATTAAAAPDHKPEFTTTISVVEAGKVLIRGYSHAEIIERLSYAQGTFLTLVGRLPTPAEARLTDAILTSLLDHGWVASTVTAARYAASGNPQFVPAVAAGLLAAGSNTLSPAHAYQLLEEARTLRSEKQLDDAQTAAAIVERFRAERRRFPGFGHPVHRDDDFRATILFALADELGLSGDASTLFRAIHAEFVAQSGRQDVPINIDGCLACLGMDMGLAADQVVALALLAVLPGLMAHVIEEIGQGRPLRYIKDGAYEGEPERPLPDMMEVS